MAEAGGASLGTQDEMEISGVKGVRGGTDDFSYDDIGFHVSPPSDPLDEQSNMSALDLYTDMVVRDSEEAALSLAKLEEEKQSFKHQLEEAQTEIDKLSKENEVLSKENQLLRNNISVLLQTAKKELQRKDRELAELRDRQLQATGKAAVHPRGRRLPKYKSRHTGERQNGSARSLDSTSDNEQKPDIRQTLFVQRHQARARKSAQDEVRPSSSRQDLSGKETQDGMLSKKLDASKAEPALVEPETAATKNVCTQQEEDHMLPVRTSGMIDKPEGDRVEGSKTDIPSVSQPSDKNESPQNVGLKEPIIVSLCRELQIPSNREEKNYRERSSRSRSQEASAIETSKQYSKVTMENESCSDRSARNRYSDRSKRSRSRESSSRLKLQERLGRKGTSSYTSKTDHARSMSKERMSKASSQELEPGSKSSSCLPLTEPLEKSPARRVNDRMARSKSRDIDRRDLSEHNLKSRRIERDSSKKGGYHSHRRDREREQNRGRQRSSTPKRESRVHSSKSEKHQSRSVSKHSTEARPELRKDQSRERMSSIARDSVAKAKVTLMKRNHDLPQKKSEHRQPRSRVFRTCSLKSLTNWRQEEAKEKQTKDEGKPVMNIKSKQGKELADPNQENIIPGGRVDNHMPSDVKGTYEEGHTVFSCGSKNAIICTSSSVTIAPSSISDTTESEVSVLSAIGTQGGTLAATFDEVSLKDKQITCTKEQRELSEGEILSDTGSNEGPLDASIPKKVKKQRHRKSKDRRHLSHSKNKHSTYSRRKHRKHSTESSRRSSSRSSNQDLPDSKQVVEQDLPCEDHKKNTVPTKEEGELEQKTEKESQKQGKRVRSSEDEEERSKKRLKESVSDQKLSAQGEMQLSVDESKSCDHSLPLSPTGHEIESSTPKEVPLPVEDACLFPIASVKHSPCNESLPIPSKKPPTADEHMEGICAEYDVGDEQRSNTVEEKIENYDKKTEDKARTERLQDTVEPESSDIQGGGLPQPEESQMDISVSKGILFEDLYLETSVDDSSLSNLSHLDRPLTSVTSIEISKEKDMDKIQTQSMNVELACVSSGVGVANHEVTLQKELVRDESPQQKTVPQEFVLVRTFLQERENPPDEDKMIVPSMISSRGPEGISENQNVKKDGANHFEPGEDAVSLHADHNLEWSAVEDPLQRARLFDMSLVQDVKEKKAVLEYNAFTPLCEWSNISAQDTSTQIGAEPQPTVRALPVPVIEDCCARDMDYFTGVTSSASKKEELSEGSADEDMETNRNDVEEKMGVSKSEHQEKSEIEINEDMHLEGNKNMAHINSVLRENAKHSSLSQGVSDRSVCKESVNEEKNKEHSILDGKAIGEVAVTSPSPVKEDLAVLEHEVENAEQLGEPENAEQLGEPEISLHVSRLTTEEGNFVQKEAEEIVDKHGAKMVVTDSVESKANSCSIIVISDDTSELDYEEEGGEDHESIEAGDIVNEELEDIIRGDVGTMKVVDELAKADSCKRAGYHVDSVEEEVDRMEDVFEDESPNEDSRQSSESVEEIDAQRRNDDSIKSRIGQEIEKGVGSIHGKTVLMEDRTHEATDHENTSQETSHTTKDMVQDRLQDGNEGPVQQKVHSEMFGLHTEEEESAEEGEISEGEIVSDSGSNTETHNAGIVLQEDERTRKSREQSPRKYHIHHRTGGDKTERRVDSNEREKRVRGSSAKQRERLNSRDHKEHQKSGERGRSLKHERGHSEEDKRKFLEMKRKELEDRRAHDKVPGVLDQEDRRRRARLDRRAEEELRLRERRKLEDRRREDDRRKREELRKIERRRDERERRPEKRTTEEKKIMDRKKEERGIIRKDDNKSRRHPDSTAKGHGDAGKDKTKEKPVRHEKEKIREHSHQRPRIQSGARKS